MPIHTPCPHGDEARTGSEHHAPALEPEWRRSAYGPRPSADFHQVTRSPENRMGTNNLDALDGGRRAAVVAYIAKRGPGSEHGLSGIVFSIASVHMWIGNV